MSLFIASLNSGSNGNCYYVGNHTEAVLIDAGISCRETEKRMNRLGLDLNNVKAIFISHEHTDHISGLSVLSKKYQCPVYITPHTLANSPVKIEQHLISAFKPNTAVFIGGLTILPFPKCHDADDPHSFMVSGNGVRIGVFTDLGIPCEQLCYYFKQCDAAFLESNYDEKMLENGGYPYYLKRRITGGKGHLSNTQALQVFKTHRSGSLSHLLLSHLSKNNNCPKLVEQLFNEHAGSTHIVVADRYSETPVFEIKTVVQQSVITWVQAAPLQKPSPLPARPSYMQLSIF